MIKAIIFDYGGVLSKEGNFKKLIKKCSKKFNKDPNKFKDILYKKWEQAKINKISSKKFWRDIANFLGTSPKRIKKITINTFKINKRVLELAKKLKKNYKLAILSNQIEDWMEGEVKRYKLNKVFDIIITSYGEKISKPNPEIYKKTFKKLKIKPEECIFIDDLKKNISPAEKFGIKTILFENFKQLKKQLEQLSIKS